MGRVGSNRCPSVQCPAPRAASRQSLAGIERRIPPLQGDRWPLVAGAADQIVGAGGLRDAVGPQQRAIGLKARLQTIAGRQPEQLAQAGPGSPAAPWTRASAGHPRAVQRRSHQGKSNVPVRVVLEHPVEQLVAEGHGRGPARGE